MICHLRCIDVVIYKMFSFHLNTGRLCFFLFLSFLLNLFQFSLNLPLRCEKNNEGIFLTVSSMWAASPHTFAISKVLHFPPMESFNTWVSLLCLNGTWSLLLSAKAITACSKKVSDLLMYMASTWVSPTDRVFPSRSDPAKSTKFSLEVTYFVLDSTRECDSM